MNVQEIVDIVGAKILNGNHLADNQVMKAFASDLMSDVLTLDTENILLITGLNNLQTIRTAEIADIRAILFVRNKKPSVEMIALAKKENIVLMTAEKSLFHTSGLLFKAGLNPIY
jgi:hypothetical protein